MQKGFVAAFCLSLGRCGRVIIVLADKNWALADWFLII